MKSLKTIKSALSTHREDLLLRFRVKEIGVFGSYARGEQKKGSDLDVLVVFEEPVSLLKVAGLENYLSDLLGVKVDVVPKKDLRKELKPRVLKETVYV